VDGRQFVYNYGLWSYMDNPVPRIMIYLSGVNPQPRTILLMRADACIIILHPRVGMYSILRVLAGYSSLC
jgi:hypothetical protein